MSDQSTRNTVPQDSRSYPPGYGRVEPVANYRPWDIDPEFQSIYQRVQPNTMVDVYRLWHLWVIARQLPPGDILEVGSWRGGSGALIATALDGQDRAVYLADTFAGVVKAGPRDTYYKGGEHANTSPDLVTAFLGSLGLEKVELLVGIFPEDSAQIIEDRSLALCHIDVDVYQSARDTFEWAWPRMVPGGVVVFDDYGFYGCEGVTRLVEELAQDASTPVIFPNLTGQAVVTRVAHG